MMIEKNKSLKALNTFGIDVAAKYFTEIRSVEEFQELAGDKRFSDEKKLILGGGSNIILTGDFDGCVVKNAIPGISVVNETGMAVTVKAGAGVGWHDLVLWCLDKNFGGFENLSLIPGLVGAAPIQNIGAYGAELKDTLLELEAIEIRSGALTKFSAADCALGYRDSIFKRKYQGQFLITSVSFKLTNLSTSKIPYRYQTEYGDVRKTLDEMKVQDLSLTAVSEAICRIRRAKLPDPKELGNAGSFFKNPSISKAQFTQLAAQYPKMPHYPQPDGTVKVPAGWLIEACGWKGRTVGRAGCHKTQALVLVNCGGATGKEVLALAGAIRLSIEDTFGIALSPEVNIV
ncbi:MAG: UDP-N-acetylmuramate dehydrogenase [Candidatus Omnitrophota bacterium]